nr:BFH_HP1_G0032860.mRNA.1.CDS.1 [Saccharomyces cerevisiae]
MSIRNELLQQFPEAKVPELSKLASARWKELTDDQKKPFYEEFRTNWEKYRVVRDAYEKTLPPKRPSGPFIQFTQEIRPTVVKENPDKGLIEITKIIGERWRELDPAKKTEYTETYKKRLKEWESCYPDENDPNGNPTGHSHKAMNMNLNMDTKIMENQDSIEHITANAIDSVTGSNSNSTNPNTPVSPPITLQQQPLQQQQQQQQQQQHMLLADPTTNGSIIKNE